MHEGSCAEVLKESMPEGFVDTSQHPIFVFVSPSDNTFNNLKLILRFVSIELIYLSTDHLLNFVLVRI